MTQNGSHTKNGHTNRTPMGKTVVEVGGFGLAEIAAEGVWIGCVALTELLPKKAMHAIAAPIGKIIEPFLDPIEKGISSICKLEECQPDKAKSRQERAENLARTLLVYTPAIAIALQSKVWAREFINDKWLQLPKDPHIIKPPQGASLGAKLKHYGTLKHWGPHAKMIVLADEGMHLGAMYVLNNQLAPQTHQMISSTASMIQKVLGISKEKAHEYATASWIWVVPNAVGALGASVAIAGTHLAGWPKGFVGRLLGRPKDTHIHTP